MNMDGGTYEELQPGETFFPGWIRSIEEFKLLSSADFKDPLLGDVLHWHISLCKVCTRALKSPPPPFGHRRDFCEEYFEIIQDYADYEGHYAMRGNP